MESNFIIFYPLYDHLPIFNENDPFPYLYLIQTVENEKDPVILTHKILLLLALYLREYLPSEIVNLAVIEDDEEKYKFASEELKFLVFSQNND